MTLKKVSKVKVAKKDRDIVYNTQKAELDKKAANRKAQKNA